MANATPRPLYAWGRDAVSILEEVGWAPVLVWTGAENIAPTGILSPVLPARRESLYGLSYPGPHSQRYSDSKLDSPRTKYQKTPYPSGNHQAKRVLCSHVLCKKICGNRKLSDVTTSVSFKITNSFFFIFHAISIKHPARRNQRTNDVLLTICPLFGRACLSFMNAFASFGFCLEPIKILESHYI